MILKDNLIDVSIRTMIGQLPNIMNTNNEAISSFIANNIYNASLNVAIADVSANNYVYAPNGTFRNLTIDTLTINDSSTAVNSFKTILKNVEHNTLKDRYLYNESGTIKVLPDASISTGVNGLSQYAHNSGAIGVVLGNGSVSPLSDVLNDIISNVSTLQNKFSMGTDDRYISMYGAVNPDNEGLTEPDSYTFDQSLLFATKVQLKRMNLPTYQYNDVTSGYIYTYYSITNNLITITDDHTASIEGIPGSIVTVKFKDNQKKGFYRILLSRKDKKYLRVSKDELNRLSLICLSNDDVYGTIWDVNQYSVRDKEDLVLETK